MKFVLSALIILFALIIASPTSASSNVLKDEVPEVDGTYDEPTAKGLVKVRVIVHKQKAQQAVSNLLVCDLADPDSSAQVDSAGWRLPSNVSYNMNVQSAPTSVRSSFAQVAASGFGTFSSTISNKVLFNRGADTLVDRSRYDGRNIVAFGRTSGSSLGVTYIRYSTVTGIVVDVDTILNKRVAWSFSNSTTCAESSSYDLANILYHEQGHWMGLDDHYESAYVDNSMYGYGSKGEVKKVTLTLGDIAGLLSIYP